MNGSKALYPREADPHQDTMFVLVDLSGHEDGWREAHEERDRPEDQYRRVWKLAAQHYVLESPVPRRGVSV
jgi:hypothetical protein